MKKIEWNKVTWYSQLAAVVVFIAALGIAFKFGIYYEYVYVQSSLFGTPVVPSLAP